MNRSSSIEPSDREIPNKDMDLKVRLTELAKMEDGLERLAALAIRQALRIFPLLAEGGNSDFWGDKDVVQRLLAIHFANLAVLKHLRSRQNLYRIDLEPALRSASAAVNAVVVQKNSNASDITLATAQAVKVIAFGSNGADPVHFAIHALLLARYVTKSGFIGEFVEPELEMLLAGENLDAYLESSLWTGPRASSEKWYWDYTFTPKVEQLIRDQGNANVRASLLKLLADYKAIQGVESFEHQPDAVQIMETKSVKEDRLGRNALVQSLADLITHDSNTEHITIGLLGDWGVGKTGVVALLKERLKSISDCKTVFGDFNAWAYEHCGNFQAGIAHEAIIALSSTFLSPDRPPDSGSSFFLLRWIKSSWNFLRKMIMPFWILFKRECVRLRFAWELHWIKILALVVPGLGLPVLAWLTKNAWLTNAANIVGKNSAITIVGGMAGVVLIWKIVWEQVKSIVAQPWTKELGTYLKLPDYKKDLGTIPVMRSQIKELCKIRLGGVGSSGRRNVCEKRRLVFVVDDLDRCSPEGIVKTFEAIRLVMDTPKVIVLIAVDQRVALAALALHYKDLATYRSGESPLCIARDYLAKMIHLPIQLQMPDEKSTLSFLCGIWKDEPDANWIQAFDKPTSNATQSTTATSTTYSISEGLSEEALAIEVSRIAIVASKEQSKKLGLSDDQKYFFYELSRQLNLRNPRQIKRLLNSYNLIRLLLGQRIAGIKDDFPIQNGELGEWLHKPAFPVLLALLIQEFLNNTPKPDDRKTEKAALLETPGGAGRWTNGERSILAAGWTALGLEPKRTDETEAAKALLDFVSPYVLPALDSMPKNPA